MEKIAYPKWKYHAVKEALIVESKEEEMALGRGWFDSPADFEIVDNKSQHEEFLKHKSKRAVKGQRSMDGGGRA